MKLGFIASILVAALAIFFAVQNTQVTTVSFLGWYFEASLVIVLLISFAAGVLATMLVLLPSALKKSFEIRRLRAQVPPVLRPAETVEKPEEPARKL